MNLKDITDPAKLQLHFRGRCGIGRPSAKYGTIPPNPMMNALSTICAFTLAVTLAHDASAEGYPIARNAAALAAALAEERIGTHFDIEAVVSYPCNSNCCNFAIEDKTGAVVLRESTFWPDCPLRGGDRVRVKGTVERHRGTEVAVALSTSTETIAHGPAPKPLPCSANEFLEGKCDSQLVELRGTVWDVFQDEIDPIWTFLVIQQGRHTVYASHSADRTPGMPHPALIGAEVSLTGICVHNLPGTRHLIGRHLQFSGPDAITIIRKAPSDPFNVPELTSLRRTGSADVGHAGRHRAAGRVIAAWHGDQILLRTGDGDIVRVDLEEAPAPAYGESVEVVGYPETDLYRLNLSHAIWRRASITFAVEPPPTELSAGALMTNKFGMAAVQVRNHGKAVRLKGIVRGLPPSEIAEGRMILESDKWILPVDVSACPNALDGVEIGCTLDLSGICLVETENWRPNAPFPHVDGFALIVRTPNDVRILSRPPWWTPGKFLAVISALLAMLAGVFAWNRSLNRLADRRGQELAKESVARMESEIKVYERTRLAVELHDSIAQSLTGIALEMRTAGRLIGPESIEARQHVELAGKSLDACRAELRNCLWDLRNNALEESDMETAIRQTLLPHLDGAQLVLRFNVPRDRLTDNTVHNILCVVRELVTNAVRHGKASVLHIAGALEDNRLFFSVKDNGCGFDPASCPGMDQGHFGIQGIRERVKTLGGEVTIESVCGKGTKVTIMGSSCGLRVEGSQFPV